MEVPWSGSTFTTLVGQTTAWAAKPKKQRTIRKVKVFAFIFVLVLMNDIN
jgi:hypothetical protein